MKKIVPIVIVVLAIILAILLVLNYGVFKFKENSPKSSETTSTIRFDGAKKIALVHARVEEKDIENYAEEIQGSGEDAIYIISFDAKGQHFETKILRETGEILEDNQGSTQLDETGNEELSEPESEENAE